MAKSKKEFYNKISNDSLKYNGAITFTSKAIYDTIGKSIYYEGEITDINYLKIYEAVSNKLTINNINDYCLDRFVRKTLSKDKVKFYNEPGYYGGFLIDQGVLDIINGFIAHLNINKDGKDNTLHIETILIQEYGYILPKLKNKQWTFTKVKLDKIEPYEGMKHVNQDIIEKYIEDMGKANKKDYNLTCLGCLSSSTLINYRLIDGYHRYCAAVQSGLVKEIDVVCCNELGGEL